jgi:hypothetical protein
MGPRPDRQRRGNSPVFYKNVGPVQSRRGFVPFARAGRGDPHAGDAPTHPQVVGQSEPSGTDRVLINEENVGGVRKRAQSGLHGLSGQERRCGGQIHGRPGCFRADPASAPTGRPVADHHPRRPVLHRHNGDATRPAPSPPRRTGIALARQIRTPPIGRVLGQIPGVVNTGFHRPILSHFTNRFNPCAGAAARPKI